MMSIQKAAPAVLPASPAQEGPAAPGAAPQPVVSRISTLCGILFGYIFIALAIVVTVETAARKLLGFSLQGADELGGYALAVGSTLAMCVALVERSHIRIDLLHFFLPKPVQVFLNWLSAVLIAGFGLLLVYVCASIVRETMEYGSTAPTPWATPLIWPQGLWYAGLLGFAVLAAGMAIHATRLMAAGKHDELNRRYGPKVAKEELQEELDDLSRR